ncbi:hypothetical protein [Chromobacterium violaceum]|uniref:hypothetical protein n=1 Tax=Chromobacterium violaceum TaxID=536 RepID=UPI001B31A2B4|nr:hypothetical protein [Chromobacterium violaceum]MBP4046218.1 hypothetical protein [Chromobacterium violaceum]
MTYAMLAPDCFTDEHKSFLAGFRQSMEMLSSSSNMMLGAKDIRSRHLAATDAYARIVALERGGDVAGRLDSEMPCEGTAQFADSYVSEDLSLMQGGEPGRKLATLNIHEYADGLKARVFNKHLLVHHPSRSILGTIYSGQDVEIGNFLNIIPNYVLEFGAGCSLEQGSAYSSLEGVTLTEYEQEVCFLLLLNWEFKQIAAFMDKYRPRNAPRTTDSVIKCKNYLCEKFGIEQARLQPLKEFLVHHGMHRKIPRSLFNRLIGSKRL